MSDEDHLVLDLQPPAWAELLFVTVFLVLLTGAFINLFMTPDQQLDPAEGLPGMRYVWAAIYVGATILLLRHCDGSFGILLQQRAIMGLVALSMASAIWSNDPATTMRRSFAVIGTTVMALYFATRFRIREQIQILVCAFGACAALSFLFGAFHWGRAIDDVEGAWYGLYTQRNALGTVMVFSALVFLMWGQLRPSLKWFAWILAGGAFGLIVLSGSITSFVAFAISVCAFPMVLLIRRFERTGTFLILAAVVLMGLGWWVGTSFDAVTEAMGRDTSMTGRTELWAASVLFGFDRPWLGYGYNAFWLGVEGPSAEIWKMVGWAAPNAHNGLLEIWLDLGLAGVALVVFSFGSCLRQAFRLVSETSRWEYAWPLLFLVVLFTLNLTETAFFQGNSIHWFLYVTVALDLALVRRSRIENPRAAPPEATP